MARRGACRSIAPVRQAAIPVLARCATLGIGGPLLSLDKAKPRTLGARGRDRCALRVARWRRRTN